MRITDSSMLGLQILGACYSKANSRRLTWSGRQPRFIKSEKALAYQEGAVLQLRNQLQKLPDHVPFSEPVGVEITIYYPTRRNDLDPSLILDAMEMAGVYENDRLVETMYLYKMIDKTNPRADIGIWSLSEL